jgi:hypothetical protein
LQGVAVGEAGVEQHRAAGRLQPPRKVERGSNQGVKENLVPCDDLEGVDVDFAGDGDVSADDLAGGDRRDHRFGHFHELERVCFEPVAAPVEHERILARLGQGERVAIPEAAIEKGRPAGRGQTPCDVK